MGSSLLTLVQRAEAELGLPVSPVVAGSTVTQTVQMQALANWVGRDLLAMGEWTALQTQAIINVAAPVTTTGNVTNLSTTVSNIPADLTAISASPTSWVVSGEGIQVAARVQSVTVALGNDTLTMDMQATATAAGTAIVIARDTYAVPSDFKTFINRTQWDRTNHWELIGPMSPQEDQWVMSGIVSTGPRRRFRQVGRGSSVFRIWPPPTAQDTPATLAYEYMSSYWAYDAAGVPQAELTMDTDTTVFDDQTFVAGLKFAFYQAKGFEYTKLESLYRQYAQTEMGEDGGAPTLSLARRRFPIFISPASVPDGYFPGPS